MSIDNAHHYANLEADRPNDAKYRQLVHLHYMGVGPEMSGNALTVALGGDDTCNTAAVAEHNASLAAAIDHTWGLS